MSKFGKIKIVNLRSLELAKEDQLIIVDRTNKVLGNKFKMNGPGIEERNRVCDLYNNWFHEQVEQGNQVVLEELRSMYILLREGQDLALGCWCYPQRCHSETIKNFLEQYTK